MYTVLVLVMLLSSGVNHVGVFDHLVMVHHRVVMQICSDVCLVGGYISGGP